ncbi:MAG TPA: hypothetical protein VMH86_01280 [Rhizomicrobium sp.]|nr:hypothetical protein [Rhizomicrobium sp.]
MNGTILAALFSMFLLVVLVSLPLLPAVIIYRLFPSTMVAASGPLSGLTLKSSGAFSVYIVVFLVMAPFAYRTYDLVNDVSSPSWTITGRLQLTDANGKAITDSSLLKAVKIDLSPSNIAMADGEFTITVPAINNTIPRLIFDLGDLGSSVVDVNDRKAFPQDHTGSLIEFRQPIAMQLVSATPYNADAAPLQPLAAPAPGGQK